MIWHFGYRPPFGVAPENSDLRPFKPSEDQRVV
jgi:hypothetical protein